MKVKPLLLLTVLCVCPPGIQASTMDQLQSLWDPKGLGAAAPETKTETPASAATTVTAAPSRQPVWFRLSKGDRKDSLISGNKPKSYIKLNLYNHYAASFAKDTYLKNVAREIFSVSQMSVIPNDLS